MGMILIAGDKIGPRRPFVKWRASRGEAVRLAGSFDHTVVNETVERLFHPTDVEPRRAREPDDSGRPMGAQDVDHAAADLAHRPSEASVPARASVRRRAGRMRPAPSTRAD